jgi:hypothetical protein
MHGRAVAALVSVDNLKLIWNQQDERRIGPIDPETGRPFGAEWVSQHFQGHYERARDPMAHLHPSREEAPWLGRPFIWPPLEKPVKPQETAPAAQPDPAGAPSGRWRWWQFWRR